MDLWSIFETVSAVVGQEGSIVLGALVLGLAFYLVLGSPRPGR